METQVVIIGGGLMGTAIARELSRYKVDVVLVEKHCDVSFGTSKASHGMIYSGLSFLVSMLLKAEALEASAEEEIEKSDIIFEGFERWDPIFHELDVNHLHAGAMVIATDDESLERLRMMQELAKLKPEWPIEVLDRDGVFEREPNVHPDTLAGLYEEGHLLIQYPWDVVIALAENARANGIRMMFDAEVNGFSRSNGRQVVETVKGPIKTDFVVNAAGPWAADVAKLANACNFELKYFRGDGLITDKRCGRFIKNFVMDPPTPGISKGTQPTFNGNLRLGTVYAPIEDKDDKATDREGIDTILERARSVVPGIIEEHIIACYSGIRNFSARDPEEYIVEFAPNNPKFLNAVLRLPGFAPTPAKAETAVRMLGEAGLDLTKKENFNPHRKGIPLFRNLDNAQRKDLVAQDPKWGRIVCRCETVTEAEILEAIRRGATTLDGVKFRTRAGMGRCHTNFCSHRLVEIMARELNVKPSEITKKGGGSRILA